MTKSGANRVTVYNSKSVQHPSTLKNSDGRSNQYTVTELFTLMPNRFESDKEYCEDIEKNQIADINFNLDDDVSIIEKLMLLRQYCIKITERRQRKMLLLDYWLLDAKFWQNKIQNMEDKNMKELALFVASDLNEINFDDWTQITNQFKAEQSLCETMDAIESFIKQLETKNITLSSPLEALDKEVVDEVNDKFNQTKQVFLELVQSQKQYSGVIDVNLNEGGNGKVEGRLKTENSDENVKDQDIDFKNDYERKLMILQNYFTSGMQSEYETQFDNMILRQRDEKVVKPQKIVYKPSVDYVFWKINNDQIEKNDDTSEIYDNLDKIFQCQ